MIVSTELQKNWEKREKIVAFLKQELDEIEISL